MNLFNVIDEIQQVDPEFQDRMSPRRDAIKNITSFGSKVAVAALPFAFSTLFKRAYGQTTSSVNDVLNFALTLEYLEAYFYNQGLAQANLIPAADKGYFTTVAGHENAHVAFLKSVLGSAAVTSPSFDLTAKGTFADVLTNYNTYLAVAETFEDTGVRAYKGQAGNLLGNQVVLTAALQIHAVEARHASAIRYLRASKGVNIKPWISGSATVSNDTGIAAVNASYAGENNVMQGGVDITTLNAVSGKTTITAAIEAFDEPLDKASVLAIVSPFIKS
ncbi:ferritin-like domain-containing protein [Mucilaginibacter jinjuensis]|uniref:Ferritin-like domain-containing protein n=1 Tax=Mucilaginibacter jinjuensis TaxID=1176721 RepID=A0ABY7T310_9SPHI|nr:ferritin-like domain-containing protein [Mucilaginibacter jinjuensis]WCT10830.1 ferritin-like domain-containing protein [Mucilaginibacter jinjuensis]